jgi:hypothetical protein
MIGGHDPQHERTALKEWAVLVDAMARGDIVAMVRKGGIREQRAGFAVRHERFLLYPTFFHESAAEVAPRFADSLALAHAGRPVEGTIRIGYVAEVAGVWHVTELERLRQVNDEYGLAWPAVEGRFHYRGRPEVRLVAVRLAALAAPADVPEIRRYAGCVSWVELDTGVDVSGARAILPPDQFGARLRRLRSALGAPEQE